MQKKKYTEYCGTIRSNRKGLPMTVKDAKLKKKNEVKAAVNKDGIKFINYTDEKCDHGFNFPWT